MYLCYEYTILHLQSPVSYIKYISSKLTHICLLCISAATHSPNRPNLRILVEDGVGTFCPSYEIQVEEQALKPVSWTVVPIKCGGIFKSAIFELIMKNSSLGCEIALMWMPQSLTSEEWVIKFISLFGHQGDKVHVSHWSVRNPHRFRLCSLQCWPQCVNSALDTMPNRYCLYP